MSNKKSKYNKNKKSLDKKNNEKNKKIDDKINSDKTENQKLKKQAEIIEAELEIKEKFSHIKEEEIKVEGGLFYYIKIILSGVLDQVAVIGLSIIAFWIIDMVLLQFGYRIIVREGFFLIVYMIGNVLYYPIIQEILRGKTLGKKIMTR